MSRSFEPGTETKGNPSVEAGPQDERVEMGSASEPHRWEPIGEVIVSFTTPGLIADEVWREFLDDVTVMRPRHCVVLCAGSINLDVGHRRRLTEAVMRARSSAVVLTDDRVTARIARAVAWFGAKLDTYGWGDLGHAVSVLDVDEDTRRRVLETARGFHARHGHLDR